LDSGDKIEFAGIGLVLNNIVASVPHPSISVDVSSCDLPFKYGEMSYTIPDMASQQSDEISCLEISDNDIPLVVADWTLGLLKENRFSVPALISELGVLVFSPAQ
jgi:hypothetical protein